VKVVLLAGGFGTRMSEYTESIPKPMVTIGGRPILWHIMKTYAHFGHTDFYVALGYKSEVIKDYFLNYKLLNSSFTMDLATGKATPHVEQDVDWKINLIDTGLNSMTGGRVKRMQPWIGNETFMLTYGDGVANVNIDKLIKFHRSHGKMVTMTAVHPVPRFGELKIEDDQIIDFREKPNMGQGWINGGYFIIEPDFFDLIEGDETILEKNPLETVAELGQLMAYKHEDFWQCMDSKRDRDFLEELWQLDQAPWKK